MISGMVVVGGGIGGLAAALACGRRGVPVALFEQAAEFAEVGAGIQLGPNVVRVLQAWGLERALHAVAAFPGRVEVRSALSGKRLAVLPLGPDIARRYGAPYVTIARPDMQALLLHAVCQLPSVRLELGAEVTDVVQDAAEVRIQTSRDEELATPLLLAADGVWSRLRRHVVDDGRPRVTGHLAFRTLVRQSELSASLRSQVVTAWLGPHFHVVQYPVRSGEWLNVVAVVRGQVQGDPQSWDHSANAAELRARLANSAAPLNDLIRAIDNWRLWPLSDRPPMQGAHEHARGRIALLGDAAHPMRPYLAQGAGMAIEDANELAGLLPADSSGVAHSLQTYAQRRWQRNARVQRGAIRNGDIYHMRGIMQVARDLSLRLLGEKIMDMPWLYKR
jgi:salicylate hydroxylase